MQDARRWWAARRPEARERCRVAAVVSAGALLVLSGPLLLFGGRAFIGGGVAVLRDQLSGRPLRFDAPFASTSPDGKIRFTAEPEGTLSLLDARTGRTLHTRRESTFDYTGVGEVVWESPERARVVLTLRYPAMANTRAFEWDASTGKWDEWDWGSGTAP